MHGKRGAAGKLKQGIVHGKQGVGENLNSEWNPQELHAELQLPDITAECSGLKTHGGAGAAGQRASATGPQGETITALETYMCLFAWNRDRTGEVNPGTRPQEP